MLLSVEYKFPVGISWHPLQSTEQSLKPHDNA